MVVKRLVHPPLFRVRVGVRTVLQLGVRGPQKQQRDREGCPATLARVQVQPWRKVRNCPLAGREGPQKRQFKINQALVVAVVVVVNAALSCTNLPYCSAAVVAVTPLVSSAKAARLACRIVPLVAGILKCASASAPAAASSSQWLPKTQRK